MKRLFLLTSLLVAFLGTISSQTIYVDIYDTICDYYETKIWNGQELDQTGVYVDTAKTADGIDSITTLYLEVCFCYVTHVDMSICEADAIERWENYVPGSNTYSYITKEHSNDFCSHIYEVSYHVVVPKQTYDTVYKYRGQFPFKWHGMVINTYGNYIWEKKDSYYFNCVGTIDHLAVLPLPTGLTYTECGQLSITPSPVKRNSAISIDYPLSGSDSHIIIEIVDMSGQVIRQQTVEELPCVVTAPEQSGIYIVKLTKEMGQIVRGKLLVE